MIISIINWCWQSVTLMWFEETETNKIYLKIMILFNRRDSLNLKHKKQRHGVICTYKRVYT